MRDRIAVDAGQRPFARRVGVLRREQPASPRVGEHVGDRHPDGAASRDRAPLRRHLRREARRGCAASRAATRASFHAAMPSRPICASIRCATTPTQRAVSRAQSNGSVSTAHFAHDAGTGHPGPEAADSSRASRGSARRAAHGIRQSSIAAFAGGGATCAPSASHRRASAVAVPGGFQRASPSSFVDGLECGDQMESRAARACADVDETRELGAIFVDRKTARDMRRRDPRSPPRACAPARAEGLARARASAGPRRRDCAGCARVPA